MADPTDVERAARAFVQCEAGFAQVVTFDRLGEPIGRSTSAFLADDWTVEMVQRRVHRRNAQLERDPRVLVTWVGAPSPESVNDSPWTFDLGLTIPRAVFVRGTARLLDADQTWDAYLRHTERLRAAGHVRAPRRDRAEIDETMRGVRITPSRIRVEGFGDGAQAFDLPIPG
ncbi:hypothetical protein [Gordonia humi]|uniref:Pyridoxamine 5'-phosphate oxidase N-terminal domain-containing protein n=1 Tax=Gordonia humi TaxID=686429 RepID=A0A840F3Z8_9ACTN|nr:hypothetical protein [Gordonia humi]MBB4137213.1 hypothetical protein [Gordonia humi]